MGLLDIIFPINCLGCGRQSTWLCPDCIRLIVRDDPFACPDCPIKSVGGRYCPTHATAQSLTGLVWLGPFSDPLLSRAIHTLKYDAVFGLANPLGRALADRLATFTELFGLDSPLTVPIPLHSARQNERGFNQSELLARQIIGYRPSAWLVRPVHRPSQAKLSMEARRTNAKGIFGVPAAAAPALEGRTVILVDDVATTGSTLNSAAAVLRRAGAKEVWGAVLAKG